MEERMRNAPGSWDRQHGSSGHFSVSADCGATQFVGISHTPSSASHRAIW